MTLLVNLTKLEVNAGLRTHTLTGDSAIDMATVLTSPAADVYLVTPTRRSKSSIRVLMFYLLMNRHNPEAVSTSYVCDSRNSNHPVLHYGPVVGFKTEDEEFEFHVSNPGL